MYFLLLPCAAVQACVAAACAAAAETRCIDQADAKAVEKSASDKVLRMAGARDKSRARAQKTREKQQAIRLLTADEIKGLTTLTTLQQQLRGYKAYAWPTDAGLDKKKMPLNAGVSKIKESWRTT